MSGNKFTDTFRHKGLRKKLTETVRQKGISDENVLRAMEAVPRHWFFDSGFLEFAYEDKAFPIAAGQTISQPFTVAFQTQLLQVKKGDKILEVGTGSGYQAAILAHLAGTVHTIERHAELAESARQRLADLELANVTVHVGDGTLGLPELAPFDGILITAAAPAPPPPLLAQLSDGGRLVLPVGSRYYQDLQVYSRAGGEYQEELILPVAFVPLRGKHGWDDEGWHRS